MFLCADQCCYFVRVSIYRLLQNLPIDLPVDRGISTGDWSDHACPRLDLQYAVFIRSHTSFWSRASDFGEINLSLTKPIQCSALFSTFQVS